MANLATPITAAILTAAIGGTAALVIDRSAPVAPKDYTISGVRDFVRGQCVCHYELYQWPCGASEKIPGSDSESCSIKIYIPEYLKKKDTP